MLFEFVGYGCKVIDSWLNTVNNILRSAANDVGPDEIPCANYDERYDQVLHVISFLVHWSAPYRQPPLLFHLHCR
jgi:hypothetical protein